MEVTVTGVLPFPLRLAGGPYDVKTRHGRAKLTFETVRRTNFDERIASRGTFDFQIDRNGLASYSRLIGVTEADSPDQAVITLLQCLNVVIRHLRDVLNLHWLSDLEPIDLFQVTVTNGVHYVEQRGFGRSRGVTLPVENLSDKAIALLQERLQRLENVVEWRLLQLDAEDAFALAEYEAAVVLGWTALEAACRCEVPKLARAKGLSTNQLALELDPKAKSPKHPPFSHEQIVEDPRTHVVSLVRVCCHLAGAIHDPHSLAQSVKDALKLRNAIVHSGVRLGRTQARAALDAVAFVLYSMNLPRTTTVGPFDASNWVAHFGGISPLLQAAFATGAGRLILYRQTDDDPLRSWFSLEKADDLWKVYIPDSISEEIAAALVVTTDDSFKFVRGVDPALAVDDSARDILVSGLLDTLAGGITQAVYFAHAAKQRAAEGFALQAACDYAVKHISAGFRQLGHSFSPDDTRFALISARIASYLSSASSGQRKQFVREMSSQHAALAAKADGWATMMEAMDPGDRHTVCSLLRQIHNSQMWLASIRVDCPIENVQYAS